MRRKFSKELCKDAVRAGAKIEKTEWLRFKDQPRKHSGFCVDARYKGWRIAACGHDELEAYKLLLDTTVSIDSQEFED